MTRLLDFFIGQSGSLSSTRLTMVYGYAVFWVVWAWVSVASSKLSEVPESVVVLLLGVTGAIQAIKFRGGMTKTEPKETNGTTA